MSATVSSSSAAAVLAAASVVEAVKLATTVVMRLVVAPEKVVAVEVVLAVASGMGCPRKRLLASTLRQMRQLEVGHSEARKRRAKVAAGIVVKIVTWVNLSPPRKVKVTIGALRQQWVMQCRHTRMQGHRL